MYWPWRDYSRSRGGGGSRGKPSLRGCGQPVSAPWQGAAEAPGSLSLAIIVLAKLILLGVTGTSRVASDAGTIEWE
jgi:hypothetical protein